jgi:leucyl aminopeptidase
LNYDIRHYISLCCTCEILTRNFKGNIEMKLMIDRGELISTEADVVLIGLFEGEENSNESMTALNENLNQGLNPLVADGEISGRSGRSVLIHSLGLLESKRVFFIGLGHREEYKAVALKNTIGNTAREINKMNCESVSVDVASFTSVDIDENVAAELIAQSLIAGLYSYDRFKTEKTTMALKNVLFHGGMVEDKDIFRGEKIGSALNVARNMANDPPNYLTPTKMGEIAAEIAEGIPKMECKLLNRDEMASLGMGSFLGVAQGSIEPPKLVVMNYEGNPADKKNKVALIGKGITFDSGGLDIKSAAGMRTMKGDMAGGATVIAALKAIGELGLRLNVLGIVAATENMPGGGAQRPGDVVVAMNGKTIEIDNTDAEGRLVLADALTYALSQGAHKIVDVATLTGAVHVALGDKCVGAFGNDSEFTRLVIDSGFEVGERIWEMPTYPEYKDQLKSDVADIKNAGGSGAGATTGALFIGEFAGDSQWVHLDIAAVSKSSATKGFTVKGATGSGMITLISLCDKLASNSE